MQRDNTEWWAYPCNHSTTVSRQPTLLVTMHATVPEWWAYPGNYCGYGYLATTASSQTRHNMVKLKSLTLPGLELGRLSGQARSQLLNQLRNRGLLGSNQYTVRCCVCALKSIKVFYGTLNAAINGAVSRMQSAVMSIHNKRETKDNILIQG
jgi:hypothetical protein